MKADSLGRFKQRIEAQGDLCPEFKHGAEKTCLSISHKKGGMDHERRPRTMLKPRSSIYRPKD